MSKPVPVLPGYTKSGKSKKKGKMGDYLKGAK